MEMYFDVRFFFGNLKIFSISWSDIYEEVDGVTAVATN